ncbi:MAG: class I SAM-dependent methyltransferase [Pirellulaceae bacterium]
MSKQNSAIPPGNRQYIAEQAVASTYDESLSGNPIAEQDAELLRQYLRDRAGSRLIDFGCGTGRSMEVAAECGADVYGVDLSGSMLQKSGERLKSSSVEPRLVQSDLTEMPWLCDATFDVAVCFFSTFGMLRGRQNRAKFLGEVFRGLRPGGLLLIHGHRIWHQATFPGGKRWLLFHAVSSVFSKDLEFGDRYSDNRLIRKLFLHSFTLRSFRNEIASAGFRVDHVHELSEQNSNSDSKRCVGWIIAASKQ